MAETFRTSEIAALIGVHPNTVRLYEELELIPKPERLPNGYRVLRTSICSSFVWSDWLLKSKYCKTA